jgi:4'-phosphopantetheinyl transferase EntD
MAGVIDAILPSAVAVVESFGDLDEPLFAEEREAIAGAVDARQREYATTRACARRALAMLGLPASPIGSGAAREPIWPGGIIGSLTHCDGYRAAAVAYESDFVTLGIDAEPADPLPEGVGTLVASKTEAARARDLARVRALPWDRLLFSAKEAVYKAWFPLAKRWLDWSDADVIFGVEDNSFTAHLLVEGPLVDGSPLARFDGRWTLQGRHLATAVAIPRSAPPD